MIIPVYRQTVIAYFMHVLASPPGPGPIPVVLKMWEGLETRLSSYNVIIEHYFCVCILKHNNYTFTELAIACKSICTVAEEATVRVGAFGI